MSFLPSSVRHAAHGVFVNVVEKVTPVPSKSQFENKRLLTPEEFVVAGDHLVSTVGSWEWASGDAKLRKSYLPGTKQFLVTRNVPCKQRALDLVGAYQEDVDGSGADQWVMPNSSAASAKVQAIPAGGHADKERQVANADDDDDDDDDDTFVPAQSKSAHRSYDLYITYDKYYQVPRFWLVGYDSSNKLLSISDMQEDVSADHMSETVTADPFPHQKSLKAMSIHPCQHAHTIKVLADSAEDSGRRFPLQHYLILFLKFIAGVVPTIEYDYSMEYDVA